MYGKVEEAYFAVYLSGSYEMLQQDGYHLVVCRGRRSGVVIEAVGVVAANERGIYDLKQYANELSQIQPRFMTEREFQVDYTGMLSGKELSLRIKEVVGPEALIDGQPVCYDHYN